MLAPCSLAGHDRVAAGLSSLAGSGLQRGLRRLIWVGQWSIPPLGALPVGSLVQPRSVKPAGRVGSHERRTGQVGRGQPEVSRMRGWRHRRSSVTALAGRCACTVESAGNHPAAAAGSKRRLRRYRRAG